jgi:hypothetical protein
MPDDDALLRNLRKANPNPLDEAEVVALLRTWLEKEGWNVARAQTHGIDVEAKRDSERWLIEAKGWKKGNSPNQQGAFNEALGQCLRRMDRTDAKYSMAFPDIPIYRRLWENLPVLAKQRIGISCLFVTRAGNVEEIMYK